MASRTRFIAVSTARLMLAVAISCPSTAADTFPTISVTPQPIFAQEALIPRFAVAVGRGKSRLYALSAYLRFYKAFYKALLIDPLGPIPLPQPYTVSRAFTEMSRLQLHRMTQVFQQAAMPLAIRPFPEAIARLAEAPDATRPIQVAVTYPRPQLRPMWHHENIWNASRQAAKAHSPGLLPANIGGIQMQYHGWFNAFGENPEFKETDLRLELEVNPQGESQGGFVSGRFVYADRPGRPAAVEDLWIPRNLLEAPQHSVSRLAGDNKNVAPHRVLISGVDRDGNRIYYVDLENGICFSGCVRSGETQEEHINHLAQEIVNDFRTRKEEANEYEAIGVALELIATVHDQIRKDVLFRALVILGPDATPAVHAALEGMPADLVPPVALPQTNRELVEARIAQLLAEHPDQASRLFQFPLQQGDLTTSLPYRILPRGWVWLRKLVGLPAGDVNVVRAFLEDYLQQPTLAAHYGFFRMSALDLILAAVQESVPRYHVETYSHYRMVQKLLAGWTRPITDKELADAVDGRLWAVNREMLQMWGRTDRLWRHNVMYEMAHVQPRNDADHLVQLMRANRPDRIILDEADFVSAEPARSVLIENSAVTLSNSLILKIAKRWLLPALNIFRINLDLRTRWNAGFSKMRLFRSA